MDVKPLLIGSWSYKPEGMKLVRTIIALGARERFDLADPAAVRGNVVYVEAPDFPILGLCEAHVVSDPGLQRGGRDAWRGREGADLDRRRDIIRGTDSCWHRVDLRNGRAGLAGEKYGGCLEDTIPD